MAALTWFVTNNLASVHQEMSETSPGAEAYASPVYGWIVSTGAGPDWSPADSQVEQAAATFTGTTQPDGSIDTTNGDCWRTDVTYSGDFAAANWEFHGAVRANNNGGAQDGNLEYRLFRSANADGSGATEITPTGNAVGSTYTNLATTVTQDSTVTKAFDAFTVSNEYIFVQVGCKRTGAGGMTQADVNFRVGTGASRVVSANFTAAANPLKGTLLLMGAGK
jgi:hypothetical protein